MAIIMGLCTGFDLEGSDDFDYSIASTDGKGITDIARDITSSQDSILNTLAKQYKIDVVPLSLVPLEKDEVMGPWQDPFVLLNTAQAMYQALEEEGNFLLGKKMGGKKITLRTLQFYKLSLYDIIKFCKVATQKNKKIRFMVY
jgi:hypothetical protein